MKKSRRMSIFEFENNLSSVSSVDWARLAALIDSEGTVYVNRTNPRGRAKSVQHILAVTIANTSTALMTWIFDTFGGSVSEIDSKGLQCYNWRVNARQAGVVLERCLEHMIIKREQARTGIAFQATKAVNVSGEILGEQVIELRDDTARLIKQFNMALNHDYIPQSFDTTDEEFAMNLATASPIDLVRLATFVDAEGTIYINKAKRKNLTTHRWSLSVCVVNTSPQLLNWLLTNFGGRVYKHAEARKKCWMWKLGAIKSELLLKYCSPYFLIKAEQAKLALEFRTLITRGNKTKVTGELLSKREDLRNQIHLLNSPRSKIG